MPKPTKLTQEVNSLEELAALSQKKSRFPKQKWVEIGGQKVFGRSIWERNYARYLELLKGSKNIADWRHEPKTFWFEGIKRGVCSYKPDFSVTENDGEVWYVEIKGFMDAKSATKLKRMKKYYPEILIRVISKDWFEHNNPIFSGMADGWENGA